MNQEQIDQQEFIRQLTIHTAVQLQSRAQAMIEHACTHQEVSQTIIECVIGGKKFMGMIWNARTEGTHGDTSQNIVLARYTEIERYAPKDPSGKLPSVLTDEELVNAIAAAREFKIWLHIHKPVIVNDAINAFIEIGRKHQSTDSAFEFIMTLDDARHILKCVAEAGM